MLQKIFQFKKKNPKLKSIKIVVVENFSIKKKEFQSWKKYKKFDFGENFSVWKKNYKNSTKNLIFLKHFLIKKKF